ncbi:MAG TPA: glutamate--tRNA ligase [Solirubrobacteraceae bacterium]|nr:glutamate--tRNA ligase [Solirubrobacteraceae bacterium]
MRLRFAPSPTGALHIGGARTALYNFLLARASGGALILRIEDTDRERSSAENIEQILDALRWLEIDYDEGPFLQSAREQRHRQALAALLESGRAYRCLATAADVKAFKERHGAQRGFRGRDDGEGAIRLRVPEQGETVVHDLIRGDTVFAHAHLDDPVIARADGSVLYNFAVAIDDLDDRVSHVVRGEDHLSNTPKQLLVIEAARELGLGGEDGPPAYAHLPLLHGPDGRKLSKRHGAASVQELRTEGLLPEAVCNYLALLGWGAGDDQTVLSREQLIARFTLERVSRNPARFDAAKLRWLNGIYIRALPAAELAARLQAFIATEQPEHAQALARHPQLLHRAAAISQEKIQTLAEFWPLAGFLFERREIDAQAAARHLDRAGRELLMRAYEALRTCEPFDERQIELALAAIIARERVKPGALYQPIRVAIAGRAVSPGIFESLAALGREQALERMKDALQTSAQQLALDG